MIGKLSGSKLHTIWQNLERTQVSSPFLDFPVYTVDSQEDFFSLLLIFPFSVIVVTPCFLHILMVVC